MTPRALALATLLSVSGVLAALSGSARATCDDTSCAAKDSNTICLKSMWACETESCQSLSSNPTPDCTPLHLCELQTETIAPAGTPCESDGLSCTTDVCGSAAAGTAGVCTHASSGGIECSGTCVTAGCCASPNSCPSPNVCPNNGGSCGCPNTEKDCNGSCIATTMCCVDTDCPGNATNHQHGVCAASGCVLACDAMYAPCGASCIPVGQCCSSTDCMNTTDPCHVQQGTCTAGACTYGNNDGVACNFDNNACTPDTCSGGSCHAGTAIVCPQRECHSVATCDTTTGDCVDTVDPDGMTCGGNGCSSTTGKCATGMCSVPPIICTMLNSACQVGMCDASKPVGTPCSAANIMNGTPCSVSNKCMLDTTCSDGQCLGAPVQCTPSGPCRLSTCDPMSGLCTEIIAPATITSCSIVGSCMQNGLCDTNGDCKGDSVPDGTPCSSPGCEVAATCASGMCTCLSRADLSLVAPSGDGGTNASTHHGCSCEVGHGRPSPAPFALLWIVGVLYALRRRRTTWAPRRAPRS